MTDALQIPAELLPADGRFGAGPSKIQTSHLDALAATGAELMGTSHRQAPVKKTVGRVREGLAALFDLPEGYEVVLGNGGATAFWDIACFGLIREKSQHLSFGEFSSKFATSAKKAPWLADPSVITSEPGLAARRRGRGRRRHLRLGAQRDLDRRDGARTPPRGRRRRRAGARRRHLRRRRAAGRPDRGRRLLLRARRSASPPTAASGSPSCRRARWPGPRRSRRSDRYVPPFFDLPTAIDNSSKNQTYNTPSVATLFLMAEQLDWMNAQGGLKGMVERTTASSDALYGWAERTAYTTPYVADPADRSLVIGTVDFDDSIDAAAIAATLRANGIVDTEPYRKLGRNQLRIAMYPAIDPSDVEKLTAAIDYVVENS